MRALHYAALVGVSLVLSGCGQPLSIDKKVTLEAGDITGAALVDAPKSQQKIKVEFTSSESPINVYVVLGSDEKAIFRELEKIPVKMADLVASKEKSKGDTLEATIPAGKDYGIYLSGASKKTEVTLKVTGR